MTARSTSVENMFPSMIPDLRAISAAAMIRLKRAVCIVPIAQLSLQVNFSSRAISATLTILENTAARIIITSVTI